MVERAVTALVAAGLPAHALAQRSDARDSAGVAVGTMHRMKGLEFRCVAVIGLNEHAMPAGLTPEADDPVARAQDLQRERCLLFVACTRAREELAVTWHGKPSVLL
jgi:superfamily I DNA/RNA helicase